MRVVVVSVVVFLFVTVLVLQRTSADSPPGTTASGETVQAASAAVAPSPQVSTPMAAAPTAVVQQPSNVAVVPTATQQVATLPQVTQPTLTATTDTAPEPVATRDDSAVESETLAETLVDEGSEQDVTRHPLSASESEDDAEFVAASLLDDPAWSGAIQTLDGGVIGMVISGTANVRSEPVTASDVVVELYDGWPVTLYAQVTGEWVGDTNVWYQTVSGSYISASVVVPFIAPEPGTLYAGNWLDINLSMNYAFAYVDDTPVNAMIIMTGKEGFETPVGEHTIFRRVENDILDAGTLGFEPGDPEYYYLTDVKYVQYFADGGFALHGNYWSDPWEFGLSRSHGCVNFMEEDAGWLWLFLDIGSTVSVHY